MISPEAESGCLPSTFDESVPNLHVYEKSPHCKLGFRCGYVCGSERTMLEHLRNVHNYRIKATRGRTRDSQREEVEAQWNRARDFITAQRLYPSGMVKTI